MAITSEYTGGYEVVSIVPKGIYTGQILFTDAIQLIPEDRKTVFSLYYLDGYKSSIKVSYSLSADNLSYSQYVEVLNISALGNYLFFYLNTDVTGYIKFKLEITGSVEMEYNQLGVLKGVRTRSFILLEGPNEHRAYTSLENITERQPLKLVNISGVLKLAGIKGAIQGLDTELQTGSSIVQTEILGNTVLMCYRDSSTNYLMLKVGTLNYDNSITWTQTIQVSATALQVNSLMQSFTIKKLTSSKVLIAYVATGGTAYIVAGDIVNGVLSLGALTSVGAVNVSYPFVNLLRLTDTKAVLFTANTSTCYPQYMSISVGANNSFLLGSNYVPYSVACLYLTGCLVDENYTSGPLFVACCSYSSGYALTGNYTTGTSSISVGAAVAVSTSTCSANEFALTAFNTTRCMLSYTKDTSTHKLSLAFFNLNGITLTQSDVFTSTIDADKCNARILANGKILHIFSYSTSSKLYGVISDYTTNSIAWGTPFELSATLAVYSSCPVVVNGFRYIVFYVTESIHSLHSRVYDDDRNLYVGLSNQNISAGNPAEIKVVSQICGKFTGLNPGDQYYIQSDGTISQTVTIYPAGTAISDTEMFVKK